MNDAGSHSEYFEELCALAASGQISESEFVELSDHMRNCVRCQSVYGDFIDLVHNKLPLADPELTGSFKLGRPSSEGVFVSRTVCRKGAQRGSCRFTRGTAGYSGEQVRKFVVSPAELRTSCSAGNGLTRRDGRCSWLRLAPEQRAQCDTRGRVGCDKRTDSSAGKTRTWSDASPAPQMVPESRPQSPPLPLNAVREPAVAPPPNSNEAELAQVRQDYADCGRESESCRGAYSKSHWRTADCQSDN